MLERWRKIPIIGKEKAPAPRPFNANPIIKPGTFQGEAMDTIHQLHRATKDTSLEYNGAYLTTKELKEFTSRIEQFLLIHKTQSAEMLGQKGLAADVRHKSFARDFIHGYESLRDVSDALHDSTERSQKELASVLDSEKLRGLILQQLQTTNVRAQLPVEAEQRINTLVQFQQSLAKADPLDPNTLILINEAHAAFEGMKAYMRTLYDVDEIGGTASKKAVIERSESMKSTWRLIAQDWDNALTHFQWSINFLEGFGERVSVLQENALRLDEAMKHNVAVDKVEHMVRALVGKMTAVRADLTAFAEARADGRIAPNSRAVERVGKTLTLLTALEKKWGAIPISEG